MSEKRPSAEVFAEFLLDAIEKGQQGDYTLCMVIVDSFRAKLGDEKAKVVRRVLWEMIQESK